MRVALGLLKLRFICNGAACVWQKMPAVNVFCCQLVPEKLVPVDVQLAYFSPGAFTSQALLLCVQNVDQVVYRAVFEVGVYVTAALHAGSINCLNSDSG